MKKMLALCLTVALCLSCLASCDMFHTHEYGNIVVTKKATCTEKGEITRYCSCGDQWKNT